MKTQMVFLSVGVLAVVSVVGMKFFQHRETRNLNDEALLALIKNDQKAFESFIQSGGDIHGKLPLIDGQTYTVAQGMAHFERANFVQYLQQTKKPFLKQDKSGELDIMSVAAKKNNPELFNNLLIEKPELGHAYGEKGWSLLHIASAACAHKLTPLLFEKGKLTWDQKAKDGSTPLTIAAENECLPMLSYWKEQKAKFNQKDGRGLSAMDILKKKKDPALTAFVNSFEPSGRAQASMPSEITFYRKRVIPKHQMIDRSALVEPEDRPLDANETSELSEFSD